MRAGVGPERTPLRSWVIHGRPLGDRAPRGRPPWHSRAQRNLAAVLEKRHPRDDRAKVEAAATAGAPTSPSRPHAEEERWRSLPTAAGAASTSVIRRTLLRRSGG